eukprot:6212421-Pleurochrysis_carterae.AAC.3
MATAAALVEPFLEEGQRPAPGKKQQHLTVAQRKLLVGTFLCFLFMLFEIAGGIIAHSLAIVTDAAHMLSDVAGRPAFQYSCWFVASAGVSAVAVAALAAIPYQISETRERHL